MARGPRVSRRAFVAGAALIPLAELPLGPPAAAAPASTKPRMPLGPDEITVESIAAAEAIHAVQFSAAERRALVEALGPQVAAVKAVRAVPKARSLKPGITFDPRLPGVGYPAQRNRLTLSLGAPPALPRDDADIAFASTGAQSHWIRTRQLTSRRLTEIYLDRIARLDGTLFAYITVTRDLALRQADAADRELARGRYRGPLHGIPYGVKDSFDTASILTTWGAAPFRDRIPTEDAAIVVRLREAGAVLLGKQGLGALGNGSTWFGGTCRNPWNPAENSGGSSAGAGTATAAGLSSFAIGTDALGSILNPADRCGVVGLRPTFGRVPRQGGMPLTSSLSRIGPLTRAVEDTALVLAAIHAPDPTLTPVVDMGFAYDAAVDARRVRIGYSPRWFERKGENGATVPTSAAHLAALEALKSLGVTLVELDLPDRPYFALINNLMVEAAAVYEDLTLSGKDHELPDEGALAWSLNWRRARLLSAVDYLQFERLRRQVMIDFHELFSRVDLLFGPTYGTFDLIVATNFTGHPGITLRAGLDQSVTRGGGGVEATGDRALHTITQNVAFHGKLYQEGPLIAMARALEAKLAVAHHRPPVA